MPNYNGGDQLGTQGGVSGQAAREGDNRFGTGIIYLAPVAGEVKDAGRSLIYLHGGAPNSAGKDVQLADDQPLQSTQGCVRCKNEDINTLIEAVRDLAAQGDSLERVFIGDAEYLNNLAQQKGQNGDYLYPDLRQALGIDKPSKEDRRREKRRARQAASEQEQQ